MNHNYKSLIRLAFTLVFSVLIVGFAHSQQTIEKIKKAGKFKVGMSGNQPPFNMQSKEGGVFGYEVDIAEIIAASMEVELEVVEMPFDELLPALEKGTIHAVMSGMTITPKRNMNVSMVGPYMVSGKSILTRSAVLAQADEEEDLNNMVFKLTALSGSTSEEFIKTFATKAQYTPSKSYDDAVALVKSGAADAMVADYPICVVNVLMDEGNGFVTLDQPLTIEPIGMAIAPGDAHFQNYMENFFFRMELSGILEELDIKWFDNAEWLLLMK